MCVKTYLEFQAHTHTYLSAKGFQTPSRMPDEPTQKASSQKWTNKAYQSLGGSLVAPSRFW